MFRFENPQAFNYLIIIPIILILNIALAKRSEKKLTTVFGKRITPFLTASVSKAKRFWKTVFEVLALSCFIFALARPQMGQKLEEIKTEGVELMILFDVSESMETEDVRPNRLEQAKGEISKFVEDMAGSKIGLIAFAGSAHLLSPLSTDGSAIKMFIDSLGTNSVSTQGTDFSKALVEAQQAFERGGVVDSDNTKVTRVILLASDGEDQEPGALDVAKELSQKGFRVFTLAFGTEKGGAIPVRDNTGYLKGYKKDKSGNTILSQSTGKVLEEISKAGQGKFYHIFFGGNQMKQLAQEINQLEKTQFASQMTQLYDEKYQIFLLIGLVFAFIDLLISDRRAQFKLWRGRYEVPPA